ncbi:pyridoxamine 5'-phosphate oxidase family protein [Synechococcus sp. PCC 7335]|uniref:pyridoxamine 5'-phosphate oxidase family protein n=1 Tax=Synechococcus sp. (strain ATCC 29403 / PCC 7335) TaxID=91464 RepID=UPI00017EB0D8|nr:pyridoxamine 5'-phosphate oxidase family protein [Synechococcus sp. PCC 7335]EDX85177.1 pyridoxamine 5'-phosphate oxidase family protein [Synechococcus sp. PCC 7335]
MNSGWTRKSSPFHAGEQEVQARVGVRSKIEKVGRRMVRDYLVEQHREFYRLLPCLIVGTVDTQGHPWVSLLAGRPGFITSPDAYHLKIAAQPIFGSPIVSQWHAGIDIGILGILPKTRRRNRVTGRIIAADDDGMSVEVAQSFGNCPQYIQTREIEILSDISTPQQRRQIEQGDRLDKKAETLITQSDTFFIATAYSTPSDESKMHSQETNPVFGADVSHRGGKPGFIRVDNHKTLTFPDFAGNLIFNTIGNILMNPKTGLLFIDFQTRDLLYLTGSAEVIWEGEEVESFFGAERLIRCEIESWRRVGCSLPLQFEFGEYSPSLHMTGCWK